MLSFATEVKYLYERKKDMHGIISNVVLKLRQMPNAKFEMSRSAGCSAPKPDVPSLLHLIICVSWEFPFLVDTLHGVDYSSPY
jgi:hypothetical protein